MRPDIPDEYGIKALQNVILNIAYDLDSFCETHGIRYCLMGGSALGAKRHGGFIPWDDDLDVFMTPDNYEKFRTAFHKEGNKDRYYLQELGASGGKVITAKIRMNNTYFEEPILQNWKVHQGIYIDIFILHVCPDRRIKRCWQYMWAKYLIVKGLANKDYHRRNMWINAMIRCFGIFPKRFLLDFGLSQVYRFRNSFTGYYCNYLGKALMRSGTYKRSYFEHVKKIPFETINLYVAANLESFLADRFGDYMKIPSENRIKYEQHMTKWSLSHPPYTDLSDEKYLF